MCVCPSKFPKLARITHWSCKNKGNDHQLKVLFIVDRILLVNTLTMYKEQYGEYAYWHWGAMGLSKVTYPVPSRVPKCHSNDVVQTSCDHAHQGSEKLKIKRTRKISLNMKLCMFWLLKSNLQLNSIYFNGCSLHFTLRRKMFNILWVDSQFPLHPNTNYS